MSATQCSKQLMVSNSTLHRTVVHPALWECWVSACLIKEWNPTHHIWMRKQLGRYQHLNSNTHVRKMKMNGIIFKLSNVITSLSPPPPSLHNYICPFCSHRQQYYLFQAPSPPGYSVQSQRLIPGVLLFPREERLIC